MASGTLLTIGFSLAIVTFVVVVFFRSMGGTHDMANMGNSGNSNSQSAVASATVHDMAGMSTDMSSAELDLMFIDGMILHHQSAVDMAEIALEQGERPEIATLAQEIITSQQAEVDRMRAWRDAWFPGEPTAGGMPGMTDVAGMSMSASDMETRRVAEPFDQAFIDEMVPHHESAVMMAEEIITTTERPEIRQLAEAIIVAQDAEIEQMRGWRTEWFGE